MSSDSTAETALPARAADLTRSEKIRLEEYKALRQESVTLAAAQTTIVWTAVAGFGLTLASVAAAAARAENLPTDLRAPLASAVLLVLGIQSVAATAIYLATVWKYIRIGIYLRDRLERSFADVAMIEPLFWEHWISSARARGSYVFALVLLQVPIGCAVILKAATHPLAGLYVDDSVVLTLGELVYRDAFLGWSLVWLSVIDAALICTSGLRITMASGASNPLNTSVFVDMTKTTFERALSVIIPVRHDSRFWHTLTKLRQVQDECSLPMEIIVCGELNGPVPTTVTFRRVAPANKGACLIEGVRAATADTIAFCDADLPVTAFDFQRIAVAAQNGRVVWGHRGLPESGYLMGPPLLRMFASSVFRRLIGWSYPILRGWDTQCGVKAMPLAIARELTNAITQTRNAFDVELAILSRERHIEVVHCPVQWKHGEGSTIVLPFDAGRMLSDLWVLDHGLRRRVVIATILIGAASLVFVTLARIEAFDPLWPHFIAVAIGAVAGVYFGSKNVLTPGPRLSRRIARPLIGAIVAELTWLLLAKWLL